MLATNRRSELERSKPPPGDYALAAIAMDGDRLGILGMMPVMVMESNGAGSMSKKWCRNDFTARFATHHVNASAWF